ncbi:response regulator [Marinomonas atlantica]|uniref:response regulator n=1 Tax=Marinomonas atlantica TaxID=1806668 RepID=UPI000834A289|nr:response regulator [Marinomonas atlantica]MCO4785190.1 response regulator [Marinomonas atlantica]
MSQVNAKPVRIVMLDDDPEDALLVSTAIKGLEYDVPFQHIQTSQAFTFYLSEDYMTQSRESAVILLLDLNMPCKTGLEWLRELRCETQYKDLIIVVFSTSGMAEERVKSLSLGADDHLGKPDRVQDLTHKLDILCRRYVEQ